MFFVCQPEPLKEPPNGAGIDKHAAVRAQAGRHFVQCDTNMLVNLSFFWMPNCFKSGNFHPVSQVPHVPQRRSTGLESPVEEISLFINNLPTYGACQHRTRKLFVQGTANFPFRGRHSEKFMQHNDIVK